jgi:transposase
MRRYEIDDAHWELIREFFPDNRRQGHPWRDHRQVLNGILWVLFSGAAWRDMPERYGPWQTGYDRFVRWRREGMWERILRSLQVKADDRGLLDWSQWNIDGTSVRASKHAAGGGKRGERRNRRTTRSVARAVAGARRSTS